MVRGTLNISTQLKKKVSQYNNHDNTRARLFVLFVLQLKLKINFQLFKVLTVFLRVFTRACPTSSTRRSSWGTSVVSETRRAAP